MADEEDYYSYGDEEEDEYCYQDDVEEDDDGSDESDYEPDSAEIIVQAEQKAPYTIFTEEEIQRRQQADVVEIASVLALSSAAAGVLLLHYGWDVETAKDAWFGDERGVREKVGLFDTFVVDEFATPISIEAGALIACRICFDSFPKSVFFSVSCGHLFCSDCWKTYISLKIDEGPGCLPIQCPSQSCNAVVDQDMVNNTVDISDDHKSKYSHYLLRSYIENSRKMKWCPAPGCEHAIEHESMGTDNYDVTCNCTHYFCWNCSEEAHRPVDCETVVKWAIKNNSEAENANWIIANTKNCPMCKRPIEKNDGCMHMTCTAPCRHEFCWLCLASWAKHNEQTGGYYSCNRYQDSKNAGECNEIEAHRKKVKSELNRYIHYYERWAANYKSRQNALKRLQKIKDFGMAELRKRYSCQSDAELNCIIGPWEQVAECRRILFLSYVYGYYIPLEEKEKKNYFDCLQGQAEQALESLHRCVEDEMKDLLDESSEESFDKIKFKSEVAVFEMLTKNSFDNLSRGMENGFSISSEHCKLTPLQLREILDARRSKDPVASTEQLGETLDDRRSINEQLGEVNLDAGNSLVASTEIEFLDWLRCFDP